MVAQDDKFRVLRKLPEVRFEEELRGYSKSQVDRVLQGLAPLADDVALLQQRLADAEARTAAAEARLLESSTLTPATVEAAAVTAQSAEERTTPASFDETLSKTLVLAQRTADQTVAAAKVEAEELVGTARVEAAQLKSENERARRDAAAEVAAERQSLLQAAHADVQAKVDAAEAALAKTEGAQRNALLAEIADYTTLRDELGEDIERLEGHLAQRREVIRAALADIAVVVDDPSRLHSEMPPIASAPVVLPAADGASVELDIHELDELVSEAQPSAEAWSHTTDPTPGTGPSPSSAAPAVSSLLGEVGDSVGEPTEAVPMVQLLADDDAANTDSNHDDKADELGLLIDTTPEDQADRGLRIANAAETDDELDAADLDLDDWGTVSPVTSGAVVVDEVRWDDAPSQQAASPADFGFEDAADHVPSTPARSDQSVDELSRPAWADAVPDIEAPTVVAKSEDPFLDELRRATGDDAETDVALERFLSDNPSDDEDGKSGWFGRRR